MDREIHFCEASDGVRLAWARHGAGPPVARAATWLTHLAFDRESPVWRHWLDGLGLGHTFLRYDERACGLSDRETNELSLERWVADLEVVVDSAGLDQFALLGISHGAATAVAYAVRHPDRVHRLVIYGGYARGRALRGEDERRRQEAYVAAVRAGWSDPNPAFRRMFTMQFLPEGTEEQLVWYDELQRRSTSAEIAARLFRARGQIDVTELAPRVSAPTLIAHGRNDRIVPFEEGRTLAGLIPAARLVPLESCNHILLRQEPAWTYFLAQVQAFLGEGQRSAVPQLPDDLSARELQVLELVTAGLPNEQIAAQLYISVRTLERHLSNIYLKCGVSGRSARAAAAARFASIREPAGPASPRAG